MKNRYCLFCGTLIPEDGVCLRCGTKYELTDDGQMRIIPRTIKNVTAKAAPKKRIKARIVSNLSQEDTQQIPVIEDVYSFSEGEKQQEPHVDWTEYSEAANNWDDTYKPDFVLVDEEMEWDEESETESFSGEVYEPFSTEDDYDDYDDTPVFDDIYLSTSSNRRNQGRYPSRGRSKKKHPFLSAVLAVILCGGLLYLFKSGIFMPPLSSNEIPRTVSIHETSRYTTKRVTSKSQTTTTTVEETTKGPVYSDVVILSKIKTDDYTIYASYDETNMTLKTNNWEDYLAEDDAYNTCIQSRVTLDTESSKSDYLDYIIFFAPYNKNILNGMIKKVLEENGDTVYSSNLVLDNSGRLKRIKTYENGKLVDAAEYEYTDSQIIIHHGNDRFELDKTQKPDKSVSILRNNDGKVIQYKIEVMGDIVTSEIGYEAGRIKHIKTTTHYYVDNPEDYGVTQSYSGIYVSNTELSYSTFSMPIYE